jgi:hypothetical protein
MSGKEGRVDSRSDDLKTVNPNEVLGDLGKETVEPEAYVRELKDEASTGKVLHPLQKVGFHLALLVFGYIVIASAVIFYVSFWRTQVPPLPLAPSAVDPQHYKEQVEIYKASVDIYQLMMKAQVERATQLFQLVVASTILPAFAAILGYIFGSKRSGE